MKTRAPFCTIAYKRFSPCYRVRWSYKGKQYEKSFSVLKDRMPDADARRLALSIKRQKDAQLAKHTREGREPQKASVHYLPLRYYLVATDCRTGVTLTSERFDVGDAATNHAICKEFESYIENPDTELEYFRIRRSTPNLQNSIPNVPKVKQDVE